MILPESRNLEWIEKAAKDNNASNPILVEKVIRAFSLLEALARSGFVLFPPEPAKGPESGSLLLLAQDLRAYEVAALK